MPTPSTPQTIIPYTYYQRVITQTGLKVTYQDIESLLISAEQTALSEIYSLLAGKVDSKTLASHLSKTPYTVLHQYAVDIVLYHLSASLPQKMGTEIREERYKTAKEWLYLVRDSKAILPIENNTTQEENPKTQATIYGSMPKQNNIW